MKKTLKTLIVALTIALILAVTVIPTAAAEINSNQMPFEQIYNEGESIALPAARTSNLVGDVFVFVWILFCLGLSGVVLAFCGFEIFYIFTNAPKCGMSRFWALVPLFSRLFGLLVFIYVFSKRKQFGNVNTITCPHCNCKR